MNVSKLSAGDRGMDVTKLHELLTNQGFNVSDEELKRKFFGPATREAVCQFQASRHLHVSGEMDEATATAVCSYFPDSIGDPYPNISGNPITFVKAQDRQVVAIPQRPDLTIPVPIPIRNNQTSKTSNGPAISVLNLNLGTEVRFENIIQPYDPDDQAYRYYPDGVTLSGVSFKGLETQPGSDTLMIVEPRYNPAFFDWGWGAILYARAREDGTALQINLPPATIAVRFNLATIPFGRDVSVTYANSHTEQYPTFKPKNLATADFSTNDGTVDSVMVKLSKPGGQDRGVILIDNFYFWNKLEMQNFLVANASVRQSYFLPEVVASDTPDPLLQIIADTVASDGPIQEKVREIDSRLDEITFQTNQYGEAIDNLTASLREIRQMLKS